jgi:phosphinothricin acetyltransferase
MVAVIDARNESSIALHQRLGFSLAGRLPQAGFKHGRWLDQVNMVLLLNDDPPPPRGY